MATATYGYCQDDGKAGTPGANLPIGAKMNEFVEQERRVIRDGLLSVMNIGDDRYLIPTRWYNQWKKYVGMGGYGHSRGDQTQHPGPVDFNEICDQNGDLKRDLLEVRDFRTLPADCWQYVKGHYGVVPENVGEIKRKVVLVRDKRQFSVESVDLYPVEVIIEHNWDNISSNALQSQVHGHFKVGEVIQSLREGYEIPKDVDASLYLVSNGEKASHLLPH